MDKNLYEVLGVDKNATKKEIKQKFKELSIKWHPDKWAKSSPEEMKTAEEKFQEINEAYSILSDDDKRRQYDNPGSINDFDPFGGFNPFDPFGRRNRPSGPMPEKGEDIVINVEISLSEAYNGCEKEVKYQRNKSCSHCNGTGSEDGKTHQCSHCHGTGMFTKTIFQNGITYTNATTCPYCHGSGSEISTPCKHCHGSGYEKENVTETIIIPKGVENGMYVNMHLKGGAGKNGGPNGNLIIQIIIANNKDYEIDGENLVINDNINYIDALMGFDKELDCIDGTRIKIKIPELTKDKAIFKCKNKGMPKIDQFGRIHHYGDLIYIVNYVYPSKITKKHKELFAELKKLD